MYQILMALMKIIMRRYTVDGTENIQDSGGAVFVCNHAGSFGPLAMGLYFPLKFKPWVIYRAMTPGLCRVQLEKDLFGDCRSIFKPLCRLSALIIEPPCLWVMRKMKAIPVYRGKNEIFTTFRQSCETLLDGYNIVLFPEKDELVYQRHLKDFYSGFVHLARKYFKENGKALLFYPVYIDKEIRKISIGKPAVYNPYVVFKGERDRLADILMEAIRKFADRNE